MIEVASHGFRFQIDAFSEQGPRSENQDAYSIDAFADSGLVAIADGMGGEKSGRVAADHALAALIERAPIRTVEEARRAVRHANEAVTTVAEANPELYGGMGCALALLSFASVEDGPGWIAAHVGDVRILSHSPDGLLRLETRDHTPAFTRWETGEISLDQIPDTAGANRLQRAVGRGGEADVSWFPAAPGWSWLIISDGIYKAMRFDELANALRAESAEAACETIRRKVAERGPDDNFTAVLVNARGGPEILGHPDRGAAMSNGPIGERPRSRWGGVAAAISFTALVVAALAFYTVHSAGEGAADRAEVERLRTEVDSLRSLVSEILDPFAPPAPVDQPGAIAPQSTPPAP